MGKEPRQPQDKYVLRLPDGLRDRIKAAAEANNRSMNAEIVALLEEKFPAPDLNNGAAIWDEVIRLTKSDDPEVKARARVAISQVLALIDPPWSDEMQPDEE